MQKICEVGVGLGNWLYLSKSYRPDLQLYGADLSDFSVDYCNSNGINCVKADTRNLPFATDEFNVVFSWGVAEHMLDSHVDVSEQFRIKKNGYLLMYHINTLQLILPPSVSLVGKLLRLMSLWSSLVDFLIKIRLMNY